jgi:hypothetical protein
MTLVSGKICETYSPTETKLLRFTYAIKKTYRGPSRLTYVELPCCFEWL